MQSDSSKPVAERFNYTGVGNAITRVVNEGAPRPLRAASQNPSGRSIEHRITLEQ